MALSRFALDTPDERVHANNGALMQTARDDFDRIARFDLESHLASFGNNHSCCASHTLAQRRRSEVAKLDFSANRSLIGFEQWRKQFARGAFKLADENWRAQHGRHATRRKIDHMLLLDDECQLTGRADSREG